MAVTEALSDSESLDFGSPPKKQRRAITPPPTPTRSGPQGDTGIFPTFRHKSGEEQGSGDLQLTPCKSDVSDVQSSYAGSHRDDSEMDLTMSSQESVDGVSVGKDLTGSVDMSWSGSLLDAVNANSSIEETGTQSFCVCLEEDVEQTDENYEDLSQIDGSEGEEEYGLSLEQLTNQEGADLPESTNQNGDNTVENIANAESAEEQQTEQTDAPISSSLNGDKTDTIDDACLQGSSSREECSGEKDIHNNSVVNSTGQGHAVDGQGHVVGNKDDSENDAQSDSIGCGAQKDKSHSDLDTPKSINDMKSDSTFPRTDNGDLTSASAEAVGVSVEIGDNGKGDQSDTMLGKINKGSEKSETVLDSNDRNGQSLPTRGDSNHSSDDVNAQKPESEDSAPCTSLKAAMTESEADDAMLLSDDAETQEPETDCSVLDTNQEAEVLETEADDKLLNDEDGETHVSKPDDSAPVENLKGNVTESESGGKTLPNEGAETQELKVLSSPETEVPVVATAADNILLDSSECVTPKKSEDKNTEGTDTVYISSTEKSSCLETDVSQKTSVSLKCAPVGSLDLFADTPDLVRVDNKDQKETTNREEALQTTKGIAADAGEKKVLDSTVSKHKKNSVKNMSTVAAEVTCVEDDLSNDISENSQDVIIIEDEMSDSEGSLFSSSSDSESFSESDFDSDIMELDMHDQPSSTVHRRQVARRGGRSGHVADAGMFHGCSDDSDSDETLPPSQGRQAARIDSDAVVVVGSDSESDSGQPDCPGVEFSRLDKVAIQKTIDKLTANIVTKDQTGYSLQMLPGPLWSDALSNIVPSSWPQGQKGDGEAAPSSSTAASGMPGPSGLASAAAGGGCVIDLTCSDDEMSDVN